MFGNLELFIDELEYDKERNLTKISGWGFNKDTKNRLKISSDFDMFYNPTSRPDLVYITNVNRLTPYGFMIQFPGDYHQMDGTITIDSDDIHKEIKLKNLDLLRLRLRLSRLLSNLEDTKILIDHLTGKSKKTSSALPDDEYAPWITEVEETLFEENSEKTTPVTYIIRDNGRGLKETLKSIKPKGEDEIIIVSKGNPGTSFKEIVTETVSAGVDQAIRESRNDYVTIVDSGDTLSDHFRNEISIASRSNPDFIYSDSDSIDNGTRYDLNFKPDYNEVLLEHTNYILHPIVFKKDLYEKSGGLRDEFEGLKDYDLILRLTKNADNIVHIPKILYHWNKVDKDKKSQYYLGNIEKGVQILNDYTKDGFSSQPSEIDYVYDLNFSGDEPSVTLIIDFEGFNSYEELKYLTEFTNYQNYKIVAVNSCEEIELDRVEYRTVLANDRTEVYNDIGLNSDSDYLCFIKKGFTPVERHWLKDLVGYANLEHVGIVGPKIFNENFQFESIGVFIDDNKRYSYGNGGYVRNNGYFNAYRLPREIFAVNLDCLFVNTQLFKELGGFDSNLKPYLADVDLSIRARKAGVKTIVSANTPVTFNEFEEVEGVELESLVNKHGEESLVDHFVTEHLKPSGSAYPFYIER